MDGSDAATLPQAASAPACSDFVQSLANGAQEGDESPLPIVEPERFRHPRSFVQVGRG